MVTIIYINNISEITEEFKFINLVRVFGKGPSFEIIHKKSDSEFHIGINQATNFIPECDMLAINDLHNIYLINKDKLKTLKYILTPEYLHINQRFNINGHYSKVIDYLKENNFGGKYIVYNLRTNPNPNPNFISLPSRVSSSNNAVDFVCIFLNKYIKNVECYGIGLFLKENYNKKFVGNGHYNINTINYISKYIKIICDKYKIPFKLN